MKIALVKERLQAGSRLMVNLPAREGVTKRTFNLSCGSAVTQSQFDKLLANLAPCDPPLIPGADPQPYIWSV